MLRLKFGNPGFSHLTWWSGHSLQTERRRLSLVPAMPLLHCASAVICRPSTTYIYSLAIWRDTTAGTVGMYNLKPARARDACDERVDEFDAHPLRTPSTKFMTKKDPMMMRLTK